MARHRIMVVDDDADVRFVVSSLLQSDFETTQAHNGLDALEKIGRYEPDLLLMDISMPVMNGIACCQAIKRTEDFRDLPVVYLSAQGGKELKEQALRAGGIEFVEKPFETAGLISIINEHFLRTGSSPRPKRYTTDEIERIDATPLAGSGEWETDEPPEEKAKASTQDGTGGDLPATPGRQRRTFGKPRKAAAPEEEKKEAAPEPEGTTPPPQPDYHAISRKLNRQAEEQRRRLLEREKKEASKAEPVPPPPTPAKAPPKPVQKKPAPVPPAPKKKKPEPVAPADLLKKRSLAALGKSAASSVLKPRVLVVLSVQEELDIFNRALKGLAEFLPLEDPVEALVLIARFQPDIVMLDIVDKKASGLQIANMMKSNPRLSHIETLFLQGAWVEEEHLKGARKLSSNSVLQRPLGESSIRHTIESIQRRPGFKVRAKELSYGVYVKEVLRAADEERRADNKAREKESRKREMHSLISFMATELKDYKEPEGYEEMKGIGHKVHHVR